MQFIRKSWTNNLLAALALAALAISGCSAPPQPYATPKSHPTIVFMTDFGTANDAVAICKAVMLQVAPDARIMDITHQVTPFSIEEGARFLYGVTPYYPAGTVFVVVVDPGVGTSRKAVIVKSKKGQYFVLPDNGVFSLVAGLGRRGGRARNHQHELDDRRQNLVDFPRPRHFLAHRRASSLRRGLDPGRAGGRKPGELQPKTAKVEGKGITGDVIGLDDPFGSLITDVQGTDFKNLGYAYGDKVTLKIDQKSYTFPFHKTFGDVALGQPLVYIDSRRPRGHSRKPRRLLEGIQGLAASPSLHPSQKITRLRISRRGTVRRGGCPAQILGERSAIETSRPPAMFM